MKKQAKRTGRQMWLRFLFIVYVAAMLWLLFGQRIENSAFNFFTMPAYPSHEGVEHVLYASDWKICLYQYRLEQNINLTPFVTILRYWHILQTGKDTALLQHAVINLVGNVVMFVPLGIFLPGIFMKKPNYFKFLLTVTAMIVLVEVIQLFTLLGSLDIDDLILNLIGATLGYILWKLHTLGRKK